MDVMVCDCARDTIGIWQVLSAESVVLEKRK